ncbi:MAG: DNA mismatch repair protein MutS [Desulforegulaceae bacterium]|nr:DNA mismatch repair protein MutS [Desulforegulaceae bacterium]
MTAETTLTPMMAQYMEIKNQYPDCILFYRMGDFYEMFFDDAVKAAQMLEIALTSRNKNSADQIPMCGIPIKSADFYLAKLIEKEQKIAICEQTEASSEAKGLVKREVVKLITPGMITDSNFLDEKENNFIISVALSQKTAGLSHVDISTGEFKVTETKNLNILIDEINRINPGEILVSEDENSDFLKRLKHIFSSKVFTLIPASYFDFELTKEKILNQFSIKSIKGLGCQKMTAGIMAAGSILFYIHDTQKKQPNHLKSIAGYNLEKHLVLDSVTAINLELTQSMKEKTRKGSLLNTIDYTVTAMGSRLLKNYILYPLTDKNEIIKRHEAVAELIRERLVKDELKSLFKNVYDIERLTTKISMGTATPRDLLLLKNSVETIPKIGTLLNNFTSNLLQIPENPEELSKIAELIDNAISEDAPVLLNEGNIFKKGYNAKLDKLIMLTTEGNTWLAQYEASLKKETGISSLKLKFNKIFGYFIDIPKSQTPKVPEIFIRKQTLVNSERYITPELKDFEENVFSAKENRAELEYELFVSLRNLISDKRKILQNTASFIASLDVLSSFAELALQRGYCRPKLNDKNMLYIKGGRHPVVETMLEKERFVPNDVYLDNDESQLLIITGPNMAGKSTVLRQTALIVLLAQTGSYVPAEYADISITDRIFTRVGASDNLSGGQSTFMVEMEEAANILNNATKDSLVVMDEIGRGTSTFDGISIAWAVAEELHNLRGKGVKTLFATHYHELTELEKTLPKVKNFNISVSEIDGKISFLRKIAEGGASKSYGIQVASLAGIPVNVIERAKILLKRLESGEHILSNEKIKKIREKSFQLEFFPSPEKKFTQALASLNINEMTPVEALNCLNSLIDEAKKIL